MDANHFRNPKPIKHDPERKPTKAQLAHLSAARDALMRVHMHVYGEQFQSLHVPDAWKNLEEVFRCDPTKSKITIRIDDAVLKFFRGQGRGYQELINQVLRSYVELRLAKILEDSKDRVMNGDAV